MTNIAKQAEQIVKRIVAQTVPSVSDDDAAILMQVSSRSLMMDKLLAVYWHKKGDATQALNHAETVFAKEPSSEGAKNIVMLYQRGGQFRKGIAFCKEHMNLIDPIGANELLCMLHHRLQETDAAIKHGDEALRLKDSSTEEAPAITPKIHRFDPEQPNRNVIAFSLWGSDQRYIQGAINNAVVARYLYPGWRARFYIDAHVSEDVIKALAQNGAQIMRVGDTLPANQFGLFWRFLVEDDENVDIWLCRDADSVMSIKERAAVEDWLQSGRAFHVMRDRPSHAELILAGMWGAHRGNIGAMRKRIEAHVESGKKMLNNRITDQEFLRWSIWPIVRQDVLAHDSYFTYGNPTRFREEFQLPSNRHIGQNDWVHMSHGSEG